MKGIALLLSDLFALFLGFCLGQAMRLDDFAGQPFSVWWNVEGQYRSRAYAAAVVVILVFLGWRKRHYSQRSPFWDETAGLLHALWLGVAIDAAFMYFNKWQFSRLAFGMHWLLLIPLLPLCRYLTKIILLRKGWWQQPVTMIGGGANAREAWLALRSERLMGFYLAEVLVQDLGEPPDWAGSVELHDLDSRLREPLTILGKQVVVALEANDQEAQDRVLRALSRSPLNVIVVPPARRLPLLGMETLHVFSHEVLFLRAQNLLSRPLAMILKRSFDIVVASLLLILLSPLFLVLVLRIKQTGGPAFFGHERIGVNNRSFPCFKFRTMVQNSSEVLEKILREDPAARELWEKEFKLRDDPRITHIGKLLRRTSLDELPQLWNVLRGEMSLVGPRPVVCDELKLYGEDVSYYLQVRPGMTGLWQVSGRNDVDYETRVALDAWYVRNWSLWTDIVILFKTIRVVLARDGAY